jgi:hypothetical protein
MSETERPRLLVGRTMIVRTGFEVPCFPAGTASCRVEGEMDPESVNEAIELLEMTIRRLRRQLEAHTFREINYASTGA